MRPLRPMLSDAKNPGAAVGLGVVLAFGLVALLSGCKPDVGAPPSLILGPQLLDIHAVPAEAKPGSDVMLTTLVVDPSGTLDPPVAWTTCETPKPPAESNAVSRACVDQPDDGSPVSGLATVTIPANACSLFGPLTPPTPPGQSAIRPRDPDPTGGFYQPVRAAVRGLAGATSDMLGFALIRVSCALANAPVEVGKQYNDPDTGYHANIAPTLTLVTVTDADGLESSVIGTDTVPQPPTIRAGDEVSLNASWPEEAAETFLVFDLSKRMLVDAREALSVSWFATGGEMVHDRTGRASDETETFSDNTWKSPRVDAATTVHFWVVLRDNRGGSASGSFDLVVTP